MSDAEPSAKKYAVGRPRDLDARARILDAANTLLEERGFRATSIEAIAEAAGTSKVTIYRWWSSKMALVMEAFMEHTTESIPYHETASALNDLRDQLRDFAGLMEGPTGTLLRHLLAESLLDPEVAKEYVAHWVEPRRQITRQHMQRAISQGELAEHIDIELLIDALWGPIYLRLMQRHASCTREFAANIWDMVFGERSLKPVPKEK